MKVFVNIDGKKQKALVPYKGADHVLVDVACPHCSAVAPMAVAGKNMRIASDDRAYESDGHCQECDKQVGTIRAEVQTIFGLREDIAVGQRCRVY